MPQVNPSTGASAATRWTTPAGPPPDEGRRPLGPAGPTLSSPTLSSTIGAGPC